MFVVNFFFHKKKLEEKYYIHVSGSFIVKTRKSRFGFRRRLKSKISGSTASLSEYKSKAARSKQTPRDPPITSQSLDSGKSRLPILKFRKNIFRKKRQREYCTQYPCDQCEINFVKICSLVISQTSATCTLSTASHMSHYSQMQTNK